MIHRGLSACPGIGIGRALIVTHAFDEVRRTNLDPEEVKGEIKRLGKALEGARINVEKLHKQTREILGEDLASVFIAHKMFLEDESFIKSIEEKITRDLINAEWALLIITEEIKEKLSSSDDTYLSERVIDLDDITRQLLTTLNGKASVDVEVMDDPIVVVAHDLAPSDMVHYANANVVGFIMETGGKTSHSSIMAKAMGIPTVMGVGEISDRIDNFDTVIVDGSEGKIFLKPDASLLNEYENKKARYALFYAQLEKEGRGEALTSDKEHITLMANLELTHELPVIKRFRAEGIGLYRSEFLYLTMAPKIPTEEDHYAAYSQILKALKKKPVVIRTFDLGGRKLARETLHLPEDNPVLGMRGIRLCLNVLEIFKPQIRALLRAAVHGNLRILLPMVSGVNEIHQMKSLIDELAAELEREGIEHRKDVPLGIMIEVPSAAIMADKFVSQVDFVAIGTNDLIQYTLAVDRNNERVSYLYEPLHPAILSLIKNVVVHAEAAGCDVSVCGEMAADPVGALALIGLGIRTLSMEPPSIPIIKDTLKKVSLTYVKEILDHALTCSTAKEVRESLMESLAVKIPGGFICPF